MHPASAESTSETASHRVAGADCGPSSGTIDWRTYEADQDRIAQNTRPGPHKAGGAVREGSALVIPRPAACGHCGRHTMGAVPRRGIIRDRRACCSRKGRCRLRRHHSVTAARASSPDRRRCGRSTAIAPAQEVLANMGRAEKVEGRPVRRGMLRLRAFEPERSTEAGLGRMERELDRSSRLTQHGKQSLAGPEVLKGYHRVVSMANQKAAAFQLRPVVTSTIHPARSAGRCSRAAARSRRHAGAVGRAA